MQNLILSSIPLPELVELLTHRISSLLLEKQLGLDTPPAPPVNDRRFVGDVELSKYLGCTVQTINRLKKANKLPYHRYGRKYYYLKSEIDQAFKQKPS